MNLSDNFNDMAAHRRAWNWAFHESPMAKCWNSIFSPGYPWQRPA
jgi:hypothetical protein